MPKKLKVKNNSYVFEGKLDHQRHPFLLNPVIVWRKCFCIASRLSLSEFRLGEFDILNGAYSVKEVCHSVNKTVNDVQLCTPTIVYRLFILQVQWLLFPFLMLLDVPNIF